MAVAVCSGCLYDRADRAAKGPGRQLRNLLRLPSRPTVFIGKCLIIGTYWDSSPAAQNDVTGGKVSGE